MIGAPRDAEGGVPYKITAIPVVPIAGDAAFDVPSLKISAAV